jgi:hypothetical protein
VEAAMIQVARDRLQAHRTLTNRHLIATDGLNVKRSAGVWVTDALGTSTPENA